MKPVPDIVLTVATVVAANNGRLFPGDDWATADEISIVLRQLGTRCTPQQAASWLGRMSRMDLPPVEIRRTELPWLDYRVTQWGRTWIRNLLPGIEVRG